MSGNCMHMVQPTLAVHSLYFSFLHLLLMDLLYLLWLLLILILMALCKLLMVVVHIVSNLATIVTSLTSRSVSLHQGVSRRQHIWLLRVGVLHLIVGLLVLILTYIPK